MGLRILNAVQIRLKAGSLKPGDGRPYVDGV